MPLLTPLPASCVIGTSLRALGQIPIPHQPSTYYFPILFPVHRWFTKKCLVISTGIGNPETRHLDASGFSLNEKSMLKARGPQQRYP